MSSKVGFPIRKSADQRLFAPPHGLSQRTTSFIASQRQGIHRMPLRHLIVLMIDARPLGRGDGTCQRHTPSSVGMVRKEPYERLVGIVRKTSCFEQARSSCGQARRLSSTPPIGGAQACSLFTMSKNQRAPVTGTGRKTVSG